VARNYSDICDNTRVPRRALGSDEIEPRAHDRVRVQPVQPVHLGEVTGLPELGDAQVPGRNLVDPGQERERVRVPSSTVTTGARRSNGKAESRIQLDLSFLPDLFRTASKSCPGLVMHTTSTAVPSVSRRSAASMASVTTAPIAAIVSDGGRALRRRT